jgi:hypothetical protein
LTTAAVACIGHTMAVSVFVNVQDKPLNNYINNNNNNFTDARGQKPLAVEVEDKRYSPKLIAHALAAV